MEDKRKRGHNFTYTETVLLVNLVLEFQDIIENKQSDAVMWKEKERVWMELTNLFNAKSSVIKRTSKHLRSKYDSIKKEMKKKMVSIKKEFSEDGCFKQEFKDYELKLLPLLQCSQEGLPVRQNKNSVVKSRSCSPIVKAVDVEMVEIQVEDTCIQPVGSSEGTKLFKPEKSFGEREAEKKLLYLETQIENLIHENQRKQEEHELRLEFLRKEEIRRDEEHHLKIDSIKRDLVLN